MKLNNSAHALEVLLGKVTCLPPETVQLSDAIGRVLYDDVIAGENLPPFDRVRMDGYALRSADTSGPSRVPLKIVGSLPAGSVFPNKVNKGCCVRVSTGAPLPDNVDSVVMKENVEVAGHLAIVPGGVVTGANIDPRGADMRAGEKMIAAGTVIGAGEIAILAALGQFVVEVFRQHRVAILATGNELTEVDRVLDPGKIRDSNRYMLMAACKEVGAVPVISIHVNDDVRSAQGVLLRAGEGADVVLSTGGVSVGDCDMMKRAFLEIGGEDLSRGGGNSIGKPMVAVWKEGVLYLGLPGRPSAALFDFELLVKPVLQKMMGIANYILPCVWASLQTASSRKPLSERHCYDWAVASYQGAWQVTPIMDRRIKALKGYNALIEIPPGYRPPSKGDKVKTILTKGPLNYRLSG
ncbi:MAG: molybdopterin molybdotransferase MoeA [Peptococcaceae bacterium]|nr:molybdopterin molybdotransferase MoeA [Peptococcaceae bacterium]